MEIRQPQQQELLLAQTAAAKQPISPLALLVSAAVSGLVTKTACAPMERLRLLYQIQGMLQQQQRQQTNAVWPPTPQGSSVGRRAHEEKYRGVTEALRLVIREEGFRGLWKGNGVNALRAAACYAIKFPTNDIAKRALGTSNSSRRNSLGSLLLAGAIAGSLQKTVSYPLDFLSVRIAVGINASALGQSGPTVKAPTSSRATRSSKEYAGVIDCMRRVWNLEGPRGFFKGYSIAIWSGVPYVMLQMTFFDLAKTKLGDAAERRRAGDSWPVVLFTAGISGSVANMAAQGVVFPFDTIRKRIMNDGIDGRPRLYSSTWSCFTAIRRTEGFRAFYYGIWPATLRSVPAGAIQFACYELMKEFFLSRKTASESHSRV